MNDVKEAEFIYDDKLVGLKESLRNAKEGLWDVVETDKFIKAFNERNQTLKENQAKGQEIINKGLEAACTQDPIASIYSGEKFKVFTDVEKLDKLLTLEEFTFVDDIEQADIIWTNKNVKYLNQTEEKLAKTYKNQLPYEACLVDKGFFLETMIAQYGQPRWLTTSYSLNNEMDAFVGEYLTRKSNFQPNFWITKPVRSTRGAEMAITDNLDLIIR